jgi:hypothetical protein
MRKPEVPGEGQTMDVVALRKAIYNLTNTITTSHSKPPTDQLMHQLQPALRMDPP